MPRQKSKPVVSDSESDSGPEDRTPPTKKAKGNNNGKEKAVEPASASKSSSSKPSEDPLAQTWPLDKSRRVSLNSFRGKLLVDIREFYMDKSGEEKPGKKGISLNMTQWNALKSHIAEIDAALSKAS